MPAIVVIERIEEENEKRVAPYNRLVKLEVAMLELPHGDEPIVQSIQIILD